MEVGGWVVVSESIVNGHIFKKRPNVPVEEFLDLDCWRKS